MNKFLLLGLFLTLQLMTTEVLAQTKGITFQGVIKNPDGSLVNVPGTTANVKVLTPNGCVLRDEDFGSVNITNGYINLVVGKGTTNGSDPGKTIQAIMNNTTAITGLNCLDSNNNVLSAGQTYTPTSIDARKLRLSLSLNGNPVIMDFNMRAIPFAVNSETLNGKLDTAFVNTNTPQGVTQTNLESVFARFTKLDSILNNFDGTGAVLTGNATNVTGTVAIANGGTGATTAAAARTNLGLGPLATMTPTGTADNTTYLRGDGTWAAGSGGGAVTSVAGRTGVVTLTSADLTDFNTASDTRADGRITAQKGIASGLSSLDGAGKVPSAQLALVAADIPNLDAAKITSGTITQNVSATSVAGTTGTFTNLRVYDGTANFLTQTAPAAGFTANYTVQWPAAIGTSGQALQISSVAGAVATLGWVTPATVAANTVTGTGTTNYIPLFSAASTLGDSPIAASGGNIGIGTNAPNTTLDLNGALSFRGIAAPAVSVAGQGRIYFDSTSNTFKVSQHNGAYVDLVGAGGTVTSVGLALPAEITVSNSPVTTTGTLTGAWANQTTNKVFAAPNGSTGAPTFRSLVNADLPVLDIAHGGTGLAIGTSGGIPYFDATTTMASSAALTANGVVLGGGAGASPTATAAGAAYQPLRVPAGGGAPAFGAIDLSQAAAVTGTLAVANGGTGVTSFTNYSVVASNGSGAVISVPGTTAGSMLQYSVTGPAWTTAAFPTSTTASQLLYSSANNVVGGLATANSSILKTDGSGVPSWGAISSDVFTQYAILAGRAGGQTINGGTAASNNLTLDSTAHATKGYVLLNPTGGNVGIGTTSPGQMLSVAGTIESTAGGIKFPDGTLQATAAGSGLYKAAEVRTITPQAVANSTWTILTNYTNMYDTGGFWSAGSPNRLTIPVGVNFVRVTGYMGWANNSSGPRYLIIYKNGASIFHGAGGSPYIATVDATSDPSGRSQVTSPPIPVVAGDYIQLAVYQSSGGIINVIDGGISVEASNGTTVSSAGSGTANYVPLWSSSVALGNSPIAVNANNVGIGTASPARALDVRNNVNGSGVVALTNASSSGYSSMGFYDSSSAAMGGIGYANTGTGDYLAGTYYLNTPAGTTPIIIGTNGAERMRVTSAGNVGIGTTGPSAKLHVVGEVRTTDGSNNPRLWGQGRPGTLRYGTTGSETGLCTNGGITFGLSKTLVTWEAAEAACPAGTWVCTRAERGTGACDTARPNTTCDYQGQTGTCIDLAANAHWGHVCDTQNTGLDLNDIAGDHVDETGLEGAGPGGQFRMPVWCCSQ